MYHVSSPNEPFPSATSLAQATTSHTQGAFRISARKLPISKSGAIDDMAARLGLPALPEMIFGDNLLAITHVPTGWTVQFTAEAALDRVDKTGRDRLRVAHSAAWSSSREKTSADIHKVVRPYDWSYSTDYRGTVVVQPPPPTAPTPAPQGEQSPAARPDLAFRPAAPPDDALPLELLRRRDPILFADEVVLYESELDDNGVSVLTAKVRVMPRRLLLLCRLFVRVDGVVCRLRDTRVYVDFDRGLVMRDYVAKEAPCDAVAQALLRTGLLPDQVTVAMRDPAKVDSVMPEVEHEVESVLLPSS